nr:uncharacterized protein LOC112022526 [Quercus suber]
MTSLEKEGFLQVLKDVIVPDGYASNISRRVNMKERKISGLKSYDNHILMHQLFPIALRGSLPSYVTRLLIKLACFFKEICSKTLKVSDIATVEVDIAVTLCELEKIFPPSFFTVMVHLVMHLAAEAKIGGLVHYRWMYPVERYLSRLKSYVRNRAASEGSIAEGYIVEECLTFCSQMHKRLIEDELRKGHNRNVSKAVIYKHHMEKFCSWFMGHVMSLTTPDREREGVSDTLAALSKWPYIYVKRLKHYVINGLKFRSVNDESNRKAQNSGVSVVTDGGITFYGVLRDIIELNYSDNNKHVLFKCKWVDDQNKRGYRTDEFGFPMDDTYSFSENVPYNISTNEVVSQNLSWAQDDVEGMTIDASIIAERDRHEVNNLDECEFIDDEFDNEDDNEDDYTDDE